MNQIRLTPKLYTIREKISNLLGLTVLIGFALLGLTTWNLFHDHYANAATIFVIFIGITLQLLATPAPSEIDEANLLKEPNIRITGCSHQVLRMLQWIDQGACPICMTASAGMHKDALQKAEGELAKFKHLTFGTYTTDDDRIINMQRCTRFNSTPNDLQWKWRHVDTLPKDFNIMEAEAAILDCFISQGGAHVWSGDGSSCAAQIVEAVWRRGEAASMFSLLGYVFWNNPVTSRPFGYVHNLCGKMLLKKVGSERCCNPSSREKESLKSFIS